MAELQPISIQQLMRASANANALDIFVNADASTMILRPTAGPIESLEYWRDYMGSLAAGKDGENLTFEALTQSQKDEIRGADGLDGSYTLKAYTTYTLMTADAANIAANTSVNVTNDTDTTKNGMYVYDGASFTKSAYDPLSQAKTYTDTAKIAAEATAKAHINKTESTIDVSALSGNYDLTLASAIALIPTDFKIKNIIVRFNYNEYFQFKAANVDDFSGLRYWLKPSSINTENSFNLFDTRMIHRGFFYNPSKGMDGVNYADDGAVAIIPVKRFYDNTGALQNVKIITEKRDVLSTPRAGFLDETMTVISAFGLVLGSFAVDREIPTNAKYLFINIANNGIDNTQNAQFYAYPRFGYEDYTVSELNSGKKNVVDNSNSGLVEQKTLSGASFYKTENDIFYNPTTNISSVGNAVALHEFFTDFHIKIKNSGSMFGTFGKMRRVYIDSVSKTINGLTIRLGVESYERENQFTVSSSSILNFNDTGLLNSTVANYIFNAAEGIDVYFTINPSLIYSATTVAGNTTLQTAEIKSNYLLAQFYKKPTLKATRFDSFDISKTRLISNYDSLPAVGVLAESFVSNGEKTYELVGKSASAVHEQSVLTTSRFIEISGKKSLTVFCDATADSVYKQPQLAPMRNSSAYKKHDNSIGQYVHPDVVFIPAGFLGFKYWMINSHYPYSIPTIEDAEIFVSNDGVNWERILHPDESIPTTIALRIPVTHWDTYDSRSFDPRSRLFMPIPRVTAVMEFHTSADIAQKTVKSYLAHDPAISYQNGWLNFYCTYNFGLDVAGNKHRYTVCYRTQDFINWEVVRADGSSFAYNATSAQTIFSSTNGVRNHIAYFEDAAATDASKQFVRVSDTLWYCYAVRSSQSVTTLVRYTGTSPYQFDWSNRTTCTATPSYLNVLWHICVQYIGDKFYLMNGSSLAESTDGIVFTNYPNTFLEIGMQAESYKPYFVVGHDNKLKVGLSLGVRTSTVEPAINNQPNQSNMYSRTRYVSQTVCCEYPSLQHVIDASKSLRNDGFVDVVIQVHRERSNSFDIHFMPKLKGMTTLKNINLVEGDYVRVIAYLNTIAQGAVNFEGILIDDRV